ncbi:MAG: hypothetical protein AAF215_15205 [Cyanobacteria bacterium P01_A01_bin.123]
MTVTAINFVPELASDREVSVFAVKQGGRAHQGAHFNQKRYGLVGVWTLQKRSDVYQTALQLGQQGLKPLITASLTSYRLWVSIDQTTLGDPSSQPQWDGEVNPHQAA